MSSTYPSLIRVTSTYRIITCDIFVCSCRFLANVWSLEISEVVVEGRRHIAAGGKQMRASMRRLAKAEEQGGAGARPMAVAWVRVTDGRTGRRAESSSSAGC